MMCHNRKIIEKILLVVPGVIIGKLILVGKLVVQNSVISVIMVS
jgi:hypothetical protein